VLIPIFQFEDAAMVESDDNGASMYMDHFDDTKQFSGSMMEGSQLRKMLKMNVWRKIPRSEMPQKRRCINRM
jgi:hypothetical protein